MSGNTFGRAFTVTRAARVTVPRSLHRRWLPAGLALAESDIQHELERRRPGRSRHEPATRARRRAHPSGVFEGKTTGTRRIGLVIENEDARERDYEALRDRFRPGHADYTYLQKYGMRDHRGSGRASARETAMRVAAGAIARKYLRERFGLTIQGYLAQLGPLVLVPVAIDQVDDNPFFCPDPTRVTELETFMDALRKSGDSVGARVTVVARGVPTGLGEPVFDKLDADIAHAMMGINAVKGVEIGAGFASITQRGSEHRDPLTPTGFTSNNAGGVLGGISTGQDVVVSIALKPTSSLRLPVASIDLEGRAVEVVTTGRHDPCVGLRATPNAEALPALVLMDHFLRQRAQNGDVRSPTPIITRRM
jgi:chorismate synthase